MFQDYCILTTVFQPGYKSSVFLQVWTVKSFTRKTGTVLEHGLRPPVDTAMLHPVTADGLGIPFWID